MRRFLAIFLTLMLCLTGTAFAAEMKAGTYSVTVYGHNGTVTFDVTLSADAIESISVAQSGETAGLGDVAIETLIPKIIEGQSLTIDTVAGATVSSKALLDGVGQAIALAGGSVADFEKAPTDDGVPGQTIELNADVVIVGSGAAGLGAAYTALEKGASVIVLEKLGHTGGNTYICGGIIYGTGSKLQAELGLEGDSVEALVEYWNMRSEYTADVDLLTFVAEHSGETIDWLKEVGVEFQPNLSAPGTAGVMRGIRTGNGGVGFVNPVEQKVREMGADIRLNTRATELICEDGKVTGVKAESGKDTLIIKAGAVVMAAGGFDADPEKVAEYSPLFAGQTSYASAGNTGDAIVMGEAVGAATVFKGGVISFRGVPGVTYRDPVNGLRTANCMSVTEAGLRYTNESIDYPIYGRNMTDTGSKMFYSIIDSSAENELLDKAVEVGAAFKADTVSELAAAAGIPADALTESVARYNELCEKGEDQDFGKPAEKMVALTTAPFYAVKVQPATIGSMGGLKIDVETHVLSGEGQPIPGFYAAGACANGDFFYQVYPASGTSIQMCFTTGREAGYQAAAYAGK